MSERQDAYAWAESEFRGVPRLEKRFQDRLVATAAQLAERPNGTLPQRLTWNELRGTYRLVQADAATPDVLQEVHRQRTRERMLRPTPVLIVHDGTHLDFSAHHAVAEQLGPIGDGGGRGFLQHNSLAIDPACSELLGLIYQQTWLREPAPDGETRQQRQQRADREAAVWATGLRAVGPMPAGTCWVHGGDRGADFFEPLARARHLGCHVLIRLCQDRRVQRCGAEDDAKVEHLMQVARSLPAALTDVVAVASKGGRPGRVAQVCLASTRVFVQPPVQDKKWQGHRPLALTVLRIWEPHPPAGVEALEWVLGTDLQVQQPQDLLRFRDWYGWRWRTAEEYHKVEKSGCRIEELRFETVERLLAALAVVAVVAIRVLALRWQRDLAPEAPAETVATPLEITVVAQATGVRRPITTVRHFVDAVARLGGYLGRKCDGPPGWQTLWRGYQRLADILLGVELARASEASEAAEANLPSVNTSG